MKTLFVDSGVLAALIGLTGSAFAQPDPTLPIPDGEVAKDLPGAKELPAPNMVYQVVFDIAAAAPKVDEVNSGLAGVVRYVNTLANVGEE